VIPGTPLRTVGYLAFYAVAAALALTWLAQVSSDRRTLAVAATVVAVSLAAGLPIRVTIEKPVSWRRMCRARNAALCAALLFAAVDLAEFVWFVVSVSGWQS
jgi:hypothetical protein